MLCSKCNSPIKEGELFCSVCGTPVTKAAVGEPTPAAPNQYLFTQPMTQPTPVVTPVMASVFETAPVVEPEVVIIEPTVQPIAEVAPVQPTVVVPVQPVYTQPLVEPVQPQMVPPVQPMYNQQMNYEAPKPKKKNKALKVILTIIGIFFAMIFTMVVVIIATTVMLVNNAAKSDTVKFGDDTITTLHKVTGETKLTGISTEITSTKETKIYEYEQDAVTKDEIIEYAQYLYDNEDYYIITNESTEIVIAKNSVDTGKAIYVDIIFENGLATITYTKKTGNIVPATSMKFISDKALSLI